MLKSLFLLTALSAFNVIDSPSPPALAVREPEHLQTAQFTPLNFNAWRPYRNPGKIVQVGMNKGEVLAIAGKPDREESYYQAAAGRLIWLSDWYYIAEGLNSENALLKFSGDTLVSIAVTPIQ